MFTLLYVNLRAQGVAVGLGEWLAFLRGVERGLAVDLDSLYQLGRTVLVHSVARYDAYDQAFSATFAGVELPPQLSEALQSWLQEARETLGERVQIDLDPEALRKQFLERLAEQKERHDGGNRWIGTGGTSAFGNSGRSEGGVQAGGGGGRSAVMVAGERRWASYREDHTLDLRDFQVALRALRSLAREGQMELDLDETIDRTCENAGDIELAFERTRKNRVHLVLVMDTGGSMSPHTRLCEQLFTAATAMKGFKSFETWYFHNAPYGYLYKDFSSLRRTAIDEVMRGWGPNHRLLFVGDASMAPYELFTPFGGDPWRGRGGAVWSGLEWLTAMRGRCPGSAWLNPDPVRWWDHPTVRAIGGVFPMFPLTLAGLKDCVRSLRMVP